MKKLILLCFILLSVSSVDAKEFHQRKHVIGLGDIVYGRASFNEDMKLEKVRGLNLLYGYTKKKYFYPVELNEFNPFWHIGTIYVVIPFVGIGTEYINENGFFINFNTVYYYPMLSLGYHF